MRTAFLVSALALIVPTLSAPTSTVVPIAKRAGPVVPNSYIIKLKDGTSKSLVLNLLHTISGFTVTHDYCELFHGFTSNLQGDALAFVQKMPEVEHIEENGIFSLAEYEEVSGFDLTSPTAGAHHGQHDALVARADSSSANGSGTDIYAIDTGVNVGHEDFGGRAHYGESFIEGESADDENGHGTHTAATAAGKKFGVATGAKIIAVKVLDKRGSGETSGVISGVCWAYGSFKKTKRPSVATMSLGGLPSPSLDYAVEQAIEGGLHFTVAAGNEDKPAESTSPAKVEPANTVGAVDSNNEKASFSNYGKSVDVWAPGVRILSAWIGSSSATKILSGTSMATPHVAGILAVMLSRCENLNDPAILSEKLRKNAQENATFSNSAVAGQTTLNKGIAQLWECEYYQ
ncbi:unnamed protein product [Rhizoctonia solani]|uniref:Peptidase S8/S53 domain-containing protein n=1 Tax=Rhizoctonia solani TaxID=456999 RepID=A0A8H2WP37_9AGAM|nr:unnamed protein product [Rhizoctonia solani]